MTIDASLEIRKLPPSHISQLSSILESASQWKKLMAIVPSILQKDSFECTVSCGNIAKYNSDHIRLIEIASQKFNRTGTEILLEEWGCSGRIRPAVGHLFHLLVKAELFRAADYVAEKILYWTKPNRPSQGPAAPISTNLNGHIIEELLDNIEYSSSLLENVNPYSFNNNLDHDRKASIIPHIVVTPDGDLSGSNIAEEVSSMMKFSTSCVQSASTTSSLPVLFAPSVSDKSEISSGPNVPVMSALKNNTDSNIPNISSLDQQSAGIIPNLSSLNQQSEEHIPKISSLDQQSEGNIPNLSSLDQQSEGNIPNLSSLDQQSQGNNPNLSSLDKRSNLSSSDQQSKVNVSNISSLYQQLEGNIPNLSSLNQQSEENIPNLSSLDQNSSGNIPNLSSLDQQSRGSNPTLASSDRQSKGDIIPNVSSLEQQPERNIPNLSDFSHDSKGNILPNLSTLLQNSDIACKNGDEYIPDLSQLNQSCMKIPTIGHLVTENTETASSLSSDLSDYSIPNITTSDSAPKLNYRESRIDKIDLDASIPNLSVLLPERRSSLNISNTFESSKYRQCTSPLPNLTLNTCLPHFAYQELELATQNFNEEPFKDLKHSGRFLGSGAFGKVFLGSGLLDKFVAVKKILLDNVEVVNVNDAVTRQFKNEVEILSRLKHENLLALVGYSCDGCTYCLLYDYISGGTLKDRLQNIYKKLMWEERLSIALGTSKAISYLHTASSLPLIHRDIKTANILLDCFNKPKLGDFGITKLLNNQNTNTCTVIGTSAYMAPEALRGDISVKCDTFSFGVVLLELLTSLPTLDETREGNDLVTHVEEKCEDSIKTLLDNSVGTWMRKDIDFAEIVFSIAMQCLEEKKKRPIMVDVTKKLTEIVAKLHV